MATTTLAETRRTWSADLLAGLTTAIPSVPDAMAAGLLAGVSPLYGLYGLMIGTPVAALFTGSAFMNVVTTSAMGFAVRDVLTGYEGEQQIQALVTVALVVGLFQVAAGLLRLGFLTRFVSNSVMTGLLSGVALLIILSQLGDMSGYSSVAPWTHGNKVLQAVDLVLHWGQVHLPTLLVGLAALGIIIGLERTRLRPFSMLVALVVAALLVPLFGLDAVSLVGDTSEIPPGLPQPYLPLPILDLELIASAMAVGIIGLVQGAGISSSYPNPDGKYPDMSRDFVGQGAANLAVSLFRGLPVGGSISSTALLVGAGARSRWANVFTGLFAILAVLLLGQQIERLPMTALAAMLVYAGFTSFNRERTRAVWETSLVSRGVMLFTFVAVLVLPIQTAVFIGVGIHILLHIFRSAERVDVVQITPLENGQYEESPAPARLPGGQITTLMPLGSLFFAGAAEFEEDLPSVEDAHRAVAVLRLRGRKEVGSTFLRVIERYNEALRKNGGKLMLVGVSQPVYDQLRQTGVLAELGEENVYLETRFLGESARQAWEDAHTWLLKTEPSATSKANKTA
jgi:SulP family sulfate permease